MKKKSQVRCAVKAARWASYAVAGAATVMAAAEESEGAILYSGPINTPVTTSHSAIIRTLISSSNQGPLVLGNFYHFNARNTAQFRMLPGGTVNGQVRGIVAGSFSYAYASKLAAGANIVGGPFNHSGIPNTMAKHHGRASSFTNNSQFTNKENGDFLGFEFNLGGGEQYGWARVNMTTGQTQNLFMVVDYAYGTVGQAITAGQEVATTPEPASLGLLAIGAVGLLAFRKSKRQKEGRGDRGHGVND